MSLPKPQSAEREPTAIDHLIKWIGSEISLICHSVFFAVAFALPILNLVSWNLTLLVVTTIVSLEAIYLAIFIQMTVNRHSESLKEVEHDLEEIEEDIDEMHEDEERDTAALESITTDVHKILTDLEELKRGK